MTESPGDRRYNDDGQWAAVVRVIEHMKSGLSQPLPLVALARMAPFSPFHFHRVFAQATSMTPARFLAALRMAEARRLLLHSQSTVTAISARVGYASVGTFTTQFRRSVGVPPEQFRKLVRRLAGLRVESLLVPLRAGASRRAPGLPLLYAEGDDRSGLLLAAVSPRGGERGDERWTAAPAPHPARLPAGLPPGEQRVRALLLRPDRLVTDALVDGAPDSYLTGVVTVRVPAVDARRAVPPVVVPLRPVRPTDPPVLSATPLRWLLAVSLAHRRQGTTHRGPDPVDGRNPCTLRTA